MPMPAFCLLAGEDFSLPEPNLFLAKTGSPLLTNVWFEKLDVIPYTRLAELPGLFSLLCHNPKPASFVIIPGQPIEPRCYFADLPISCEGSGCPPSFFSAKTALSGEERQLPNPCRSPSSLTHNLGEQSALLGIFGLRR